MIEKLPNRNFIIPVEDLKGMVLMDCVDKIRELVEAVNKLESKATRLETIQPQEILAIAKRMFKAT